MLASMTGCSSETIAKRKKVLIVDDAEGFATFVKEMIRKEGYNIRTATDGEDGYRGYLRFRPHIIITDIQMPGKSGFELVKEIRTHDPRIKTIYMSGNLSLFRSYIEEEETKYQARFVEKPFSSSELAALVSESLVENDRVSGYPIE